MKNIFKFFRAILIVAFGAALTGCLAEEQLETADEGLNIKVFFPTKVVAGQPMTINGGGFSDVTEVVFPGTEEGIVVTDFQIVSNGMIRVNAPAGISAEGGKILVRTEAGEQVESPLPLTLGNTDITGYSADGSVPVDGGSQITIYGTDLEFITGVELLDADGNPALIEDKLFNRKGTSSVIFTVPKKVFEGKFQGKVYTIDGKTFLMPELEYKPASDGGYFETVETVLWENPDPAGNGEISWSGTYRFGLEGTDGNNECIATFPAEVWDIIKNGTFRLQFAATAAQIRITDGWWSTTWTGADIMAGDERIIDNGDGTYYIEINLDGDPLKDTIDEKHLLFTGGGYTPLKIYVSEEVWVPGGSMEIVRTSIWKNDGSVGAASWDGTYRYAKEGMDANSECVAEIPAETWEKMKTTPFNVQITPTGDWWQVRILDGHWSIGNADSNDITPNTPDKFVDNGDGTFTFVVDLQSYPEEGDKLVTTVDEKHLLFSGSGFIINEMYWEEEVIVDGSKPKEIVVWEGSEDLGVWSLNLEIKPNDMFVTNPISAGQTLRFYVTPTADWWQFQLFNGHWGGMVLPESSAGNNNVNAGDTTISEEGYIAITVTDLMVEELTTMIDWGYAMVVQGENIILTKISFI
ncbi:MAG: hypothetical protein IKB85_00795 [Bacteroidales bacterium]|nr:hypothetical protein [Bacteroidales bacterium]